MGRSLPLVFSISAATAFRLVRAQSTRTRTRILLMLVSERAVRVIAFYKPLKLSRLSQMAIMFAARIFRRTSREAMTESHAVRSS